MPRSRYRGPLMTLGNERQWGALAHGLLAVPPWAVLAVDAWPDHVPVPSLGPRIELPSQVIGADSTTPMKIEGCQPLTG